MSGFALLLAVAICDSYIFTPAVRVKYVSLLSTSKKKFLYIYDVPNKFTIDLLSESKFELVETLAEKIAELLLEEMAVNWLKVTVGKPYAVTDSAEVGVSIERYRQEKNIKVFIDIGSNINREDNIQSCVDQLIQDFPVQYFIDTYLVLRI